jgi:hypothetical protein
MNCNILRIFPTKCCISSYSIDYQKRERLIKPPPPQLNSAVIVAVPGFAYS